jgi:hypothetical protein
MNTEKTISTANDVINASPASIRIFDGSVTAQLGNP